MIFDAFINAAEVYNPDDGTDLVGLMIIYGIPIVPASLAAWAALKVKTQVQNSHKENMRDDLDSKFADLGGKVDAVHTVVTDHGTRLNSIESHLRGR